MHESCRRKILPALIALALGATACGNPEPEDALVARCLEALRVREPELSRVEVLAQDVPSPADRRLRFEAQLGSAGLRVEDEIRCRFEPGDRWTLREIAVGERRLSEGEVALVNSELLLRDLSEHPERLERTVVAGEQTDPAPVSDPGEPGVVTPPAVELP